MDKIKRSRIKELEEPDEFITTSQRALNYAMENRTKILSIAGVIFGLLIIVSIAGYMDRKGENDASVMQGRIMAQYGKLVESKGPEKAFSEVKEQFQELFDAHSGTVAGTLAMVQFADLCFEQGEYDRAVPLYEKALGAFSGDALVRNIILASLGHSHEARKDFPAAVKSFEKVLDGSGDVMKDEALYHLGLLYDTMGKPEKSIEAFNKLMENHTDSIYLELVKEKVAG